MESLFTVDWEGMLVPSKPYLETFLRGTIVYLAIFGLLRFLFLREAGTMAITDLLVVVLLADAAQNAMADDYTSVTDGIVLVTTILGWAFGLDWLGYRFPRIQRWVHPPPLRLIQNGKMLKRNMRKELITEEELMGQLRLQGVTSLEEVREAYMESDGRISVIRRGGEGGAPGRKSL